MNRREILQQLVTVTLAAVGIRSRAWAKAATRPVVIEAGRRVDAPDAQTPRFPASKVAVVQKRIREVLAGEHPATVVCSAACGADLLLLEAAGAMHIERHVLLPSPPDEFRKTSVIDRPGDWGNLYDEVIKTAKVEVLKVPEGQEGYLETNLKLLDLGQQLVRSHGTTAQALVIWNKESRGPDDVTGHFLEQARLRGIPVVEISTL